jgi:hypothetical protein
VPENRARIAVEPARPGEPGAAAGLDLGAVYPGSESDLAARLRELGPRLAGHAPAGRIVVAVPDSWLDGGLDGARRREVVRVIADELQLPLLAIIGRSQALVASQAGQDDAVGGDRPRTVTACHLDDDALAFGRCEVTAAPGGPSFVLTGSWDDQAAPRVAGFGAVLTQALRARLASGQAPASAAADAGSLVVLFAELSARRERLRAALNASSSNAVFLSVPVLGWPGTPPAQWVTAGEIKAGFDPVAQALASAIKSFRAAAGQARDVHLVLTGPAAANPLMAERVRAEFTGHADAAGPVTVTVADDLAPARGAARVAAGTVTAALPPVAPSRLPVHRIEAGRLVGGFVDLPASCYLQAGAPDILVTAGSSPPAQVAGTGIPAGSYRAWLWPGLAGAVLALRPSSGEPAVLISLPAGRERN